MTEAGWGLYAAAVRGDEAVVRALLGQGVRPDKWRNERGFTALHTAVWNRRRGVARLLIEARADVKAKTDGGATPLNLAARHGLTNIVQLLLSTGASVAGSSNEGSTPLHLTSQLQGDAATRNAAMSQMIETLLLWGADLDAQDRNGRTPRDVASFYFRSGAFDVAVARARGLFWTRALHQRLPPRSREVVVTVLLCLRHVATMVAQAEAEEGREAADGAVVAAPALPALPVELREVVLGFVRAVDLLPR